jgi:hypothetical protein
VVARCIEQGQILQEVFYARLSDVEEMIQRRLEEKDSPAGAGRVGGLFHSACEK